jgi:hypothetical protein
LTRCGASEVLETRLDGARKPRARTQQDGGAEKWAVPPARAQPRPMLLVALAAVVVVVASDLHELLNRPSRT